MATPRLSTDDLCLLTNNSFHPNIFSIPEDHNGLRQAHHNTYLRARSFSAGGGVREHGGASPINKSGASPIKQKMGEIS